MASYVTTGFSKQLLIYTSYIFYVDPLIRETLSTVILYRKSSPSRVLSRHPSFAPRIRISRAFPHSRIATWSKLYTSKVRSVRSLISPSAQGSLLFSWTTRWDDDGLRLGRVTRSVSSFCGVHRDSLSRWRWRQLWRSYFSTTNLLPLRKREKDAAGYESRRARENYLTRRRQGDARLVAAKFDARLLWNYGITAQVMN